MTGRRRVHPQARRGVELSETDELRRQAQALRERLSRLSGASLRISESLDLDTVLREVVESARTLTGAGSGLIATIDTAGQPQDLVTAGMDPDENQSLLELPHGPDVWEYLSQVPEPIRLQDLAAHLSAHGFPEDRLLARTFLGAPIRHQGVHLGNCYMSDKADGKEFTTEDEEILTLFASQAGAAIANARKHRDEQRARSDLEALIDTSPVGVVVFDARSGQMVRYNPEARRIAGGLRMPGRSPEELLEVLRVRLADGREIAMDEFPLRQWLREATSVRAEEIVLDVPNGEEVTVVINATVIRGEDGAVESLVVTVQDMTPLKELERLRAEFLGMVSHELQGPLVSIKGCAATALAAGAARDPARMELFFRIVDDQAEHMRILIDDLLDVARIETGTLSVTPEPAEVGAVVERARIAFRSAGSTNPLQIDLPPDLPQVLADGRRIVQVLGNLLTNAARNSPALSAIRVTAALEGDSVDDEGRGIPAGQMPHLFRKFAHSVGPDRQRGVGTGLGLAICKGLVEAHGGRIRAESKGAGLGTRFTFTIPVTGETGEGESSPASQRRRAHGRARVLAVDDDPQALGSLQRILEQAGYDALATGNPEEVAGMLETGEPDLVLLDLVLPGTDGIELMQKLPALGDRPVIFLSVYGRDETIARALELGAADYIVKPFSPTELLARIRAALQRQAGPAVPYRVRDLTIDREERQVTLAGHPVELTATEFDLLSELAARGGRVVTHEDLLRRVWRSRNKGDTRVVHAFVKRLRRKLGDDASSPSYIFSEPRVGYRMPKPDDA